MKLSPSLSQSKFILLCFLCLTGSAFSQNGNSQNQGQGNTQWKTNGNVADSTHYFGTKNQQPIKFRTNDIERFRITPSGDFGIGTSNPQAKLDVNGTVLFRESVRIPDLEFSNGLEDVFLFIDENGNLKKGSIEAATNAMYQIRDCGEGPINNPKWYHGVNKLFTHCPQVNVGINTSNPRVKLDVIGTTYTDRLALGTADPLNMQANFHMKVNASPGNTNTIFKIESLQQPLLSMDYQGMLLTKNITNESVVQTRKLVVLAPEDEGTPFYVTKGNSGTDRLLQLDYNGLLHARRIKVDTDSWADFVFETNYNLMPLSEVKNFIEENKHLPGVPSEQMVIENGVDLVEMNKILMQKVEELTLYLINQNSTVLELQEQILELRKTINQD